MVDLGKAQMDIFTSDDVYRDDPQMREYAQEVMKIHFDTMGEVMRMEAQYAKDFAELEVMKSRLRMPGERR